MYYYLSFLRPPPLQSSLSAPITITPQVSNDLRTEPFLDPLDIFYFWTLPPPASPTPLSTPIKLTTWRSANAYKELTIPPPPRVRDGMRFCLVLTTSPAMQPSPSEIDLRTHCTRNSAPFPVSSLPIAFSLRMPKVKIPKQESIMRAFRFSDAEGSLVRVREQTSFDLDKKLWDSGIGLSAWLTELHASSAHPKNPKTHPLVSRAMAILFEKGNGEIIELGAGTGVVSLTLAALRSADASLSNSPARILTTDLPSSMEVMEHNIAQNDSLFTARAPVALTLDWDEDLPPQVLDVGSRGGFDIIVMADVTYNTASFPALVNTLSALLALSHKSTTSDASESTADESEITKTARNATAETPLILLAYKQRDPAERELWELLREKTSVQLVQVDALPGAGGEAVEIWVGQAA